MKRLWWILLAVILLCVGSCRILQVAVDSAFPTFEQVEEKSRRLAGEGARDCGSYYDYGAYPLASDRCAVMALEAGEAFRIRSQFGDGLNNDYVWIVGTPRGEIYFIYAFDGDGFPLMAETFRCPDAVIVTIDGRQTIDCPSNPFREWVSSIDSRGW